MEKKSLKKGILITFEGPEGSGKSTQTRLLCKYLRRTGFKFLHLREPGGTVISEKIRDILLDPKNKNMDAVCEMLLYQAARAQLVKEKILLALKQKKIVILDRFLDATICYQGYGAGMNLDTIKQIGHLATYGIQPDLTILSDIDSKEGLSRSKGRDRIEKKSLKFHKRVRRGYLKLAEETPRRIKIVSTNKKNIDVVQTEIRKIIHTKLAHFMR